MDLQELRKEIDAVDEALLPLLLQRLALARRVADYKAEQGLPVVDAEREQAILNTLAAKSGDDAASVRAVYAAILKASRELQQQQINKND